MSIIKKAFFYILFLSLVGSFSSCKKDINASLKIYGFYNVTDSSCMIRGTVNVIGDDILEAGYLKTSLPESALESLTYTNCQRVASTGSLSDFSVLISGCSPDSTYRLRIYARSADSTYYGSLVLFKPVAINMNLVLVQGGTFQMGATSEQATYADPDEFPVHSVTLQDFQLGRTEVTNSQFVLFLNSRKVAKNGYSLTESGASKLMIFSRDNLYSNLYGLSFSQDSGFWVVSPGHERHPVSNITWYGASEFCRWAGGRLPSEAEWEWAARGGQLSTGKLLSGGDSASVENIAWYSENTKNFPSNFDDAQNVGTKAANELGIYDMTGNVWEWVNDWYFPYFGRSQNQPIGISDADAKESGVTYKVKRGGGWAKGINGIINELRVSNREKANPDINQGSLGFRMAKSL